MIHYALTRERGFVPTSTSSMAHPRWACRRWGLCISPVSRGHITLTPCHRAFIDIGGPGVGGAIVELKNRARGRIDHLTSRAVQPSRP